MTTPRDVIFDTLVVDHGHEKRPGGRDCRTCARRADKILHALFMNDLEIVPIPGREGTE